MRLSRSHRLSRAQTVAPLLVALVPTLLLLVFVPPTFNRVDAYTMLLQQYKMLIPHYPPLYPFFTRTVTSVFGLSDVGIYAIVLLQHAVLVGGLVYCASAFGGTLRRVWVVIALAWGSGLGLYSHGIFSEGLAMPLLVWLLGAAVRVALPERATSLRLVVPYYGILFLCILTRHNLAVFAAILPTLFILLALWERRVFRYRMRQALVHVLAGVCAIALANMFVKFVTYVTDGNVTPILGRVVVYRMHYFPWDKMTESERHALVERIATRSPDPIAQGAVRIMIEAPGPWIGSYQQVRKLLREQGSQRDVDEVMNAASRAFLFTPNVYLYAEILETLDKYFGKHNQVPWMVDQATSAIELYRTGRIPDDFAKLGLIDSIDIEHYQRITKVVNPPVYLWSTNCYLLAAITLVLLVFACFRGAMPVPLGALSVAVLLSASLYAFLTAAISPFHVRYGAPVILMFWAALAVVIGGYRQRDAVDESTSVLPT